MMVLQLSLFFLLLSGYLYLQCLFFVAQIVVVSFPITDFPYEYLEIIEELGSIIY